MKRSVESCKEIIFRCSVDTERIGVSQLSAGVFASDDVVGLLTDLTADFTTEAFDQNFEIIPAVFLEAPCEYELKSFKGLDSRLGFFLPFDTRGL